jgi:membrane-bound serine protease (ClpP class)
LIGEVGTVSSPLVPSGKVFIRGELWDAIASGNIDVGRAVIVRSVRDLTLQVEPAPQAASPSAKL